MSDGMSDDASDHMGDGVTNRRSDRAAIDLDAVHWGANGLIAAVVQDEHDERVLMVGWQDAEALAATLATGQVHFHSRSRGRLWRKGETSGNELRLVDGALDCDADALLLRVEASGPTCHTGTRSCFDARTNATPRAFIDTGAADPPPDGPHAAVPAAASPGQGFAFLESLWQTIAQRAADRPPGSYTVRLIEGGVDFAARKVAEEAVEVLMAAKDDAAAAATGERPNEAPRDRDQSALASEFADLFYHALVLMAERGLPPSQVMMVLQGRAAGAHRPGG
jgi:phosphoribosyl-ATP pyrophosphohydrolase/phosphoribosyl-AMP cyclohydrolase